MNDVSNALDLLEADKDVGAIVLTGSERAFAGNCEVFYRKQYSVEMIMSFKKKNLVRH